jgi:hypothetical protein
VFGEEEWVARLAVKMEEWIVLAVDDAGKVDGTDRLGGVVGTVSMELTVG